MEACASIASILEKEEVEQLVVPTLNSAAKVHSSLCLSCTESQAVTTSSSLAVSVVVALYCVKMEAWSSSFCEESSRQAFGFVPFAYGNDPLGTAVMLRHR